MTGSQLDTKAAYSTTATEWFNVNAVNSLSNFTNASSSINTALSVLQPLLIDESAISELRTLLTSVPADTSATVPTPNVRDTLLQLHQVTSQLLTLDHSTSSPIPVSLSMSSSSSAAAASNVSELKSMQDRVEEYQVLLGQASLEHKRLIDKIAVLQRSQQR